MFSNKKAMFLYAQSPVHMGAGVAVGGIVDNPIQREKHTGYPGFAASGVKGAIRHHLSTIWNDDKLLERLFGSNDASHAGAVSFTDAMLVAFPVQCLKQSFVYATCPTVLARLQRLLQIADVDVDWQIPSLEANHILSINPELLVDNEKILLETFSYQASMSQALKKVSDWLALHAIAGSDYFQDKLANDLVLVPDEDFGFFVQNATMVEAHVKIDDVSGSAKDGALFYSENLPPESLLVCLAMASRERSKNSNEELIEAGIVLDHITKEIEGNVVQMGGDSTTGRGLICIKFVEGM